MPGLGRQDYAKSIAVVLGGDSSVASNGFWSALTIATTQTLPMLFYIEDNGFRDFRALHDPDAGRQYRRLRLEEPDDLRGRRQRPGRSRAPYRRGRGACARPARLPCSASPCRACRGTVPGHAGLQSEETVRAEWARDPLPRLKEAYRAAVLSEAEWQAAEDWARQTAEEARMTAEARPAAAPRR